MDKQTTPQNEICYANDATNILHQVPEEVQQISDKLTPSHFDGQFEMDLTRLDHSEVLSKKWDYLRDRIVMFHYAGHAAEDHLLLDQQKILLDIYDDLLGQAPYLKLVFLNGCATLQHVEALWQAGIPAVIATSESIADEQARQFAHYFYDSMAKGARLEDAFETARIRLSEMQNEHTYRKISVRYSLTMSELSNDFAWGLYVQPDYKETLNWRLLDGLAQPFNPLFTHEILSNAIAEYEVYLAYIKQKLARNPKDGRAYMELGLVLLYQRNFTDGLSSFLRAIEYKPTLAQAYYYACLAIVAEQKLYNLSGEVLNQIEGLLSKALQQSPESPVYYLLLLAILYDYYLYHGQPLTHDPEELIELISLVPVAKDDLQRLVYFTNIQHPKIIGLLQQLSHPTYY